MKPILLAITAVLLAASCGSATSDDADAPAETAPTTAEPAPESTAVGADAVPDAAPGIRLVSAIEGAEIEADPPDGLIILDVRTPEEYAEGHLEGATMIDFYSADFADQIADLDPNQPYLLYCQSGNRSGQTAAIMDQLGFIDVADIDGGIVAWTDAGLPVTP